MLTLVFFQVSFGGKRVQTLVANERALASVLALVDDKVGFALV